jgi:hypothetical protein
MGGWSGGVYSRFRNWVTDKANSINPQASLFDQEDDGFAAGLNNCITKDGLSKPTSAMDWNGQNLTGVLNFANTGTVSLISGKLTMSLNGNIVIAAPGSGNLIAAAGNVLMNGATTGPATLNITSTGANGFFATEGSTPGGTFTGSGAYATVIGSNNSTELDLLAGGSVRAKISSAGQMSAIDDAGTFQTVGFRGLVYRNVSSNYTTVLSDKDTNICNNSASPITITIAANASVAYPLGTTISFSTVQGGGTVTISINTDTLMLAGVGTTGSRTLASTGLATATKVANAQWLISGSGLS